MDDERLADYLAGELPPDEHEAVEARLAGDAALRARLEHMRAADEALSTLSPPRPRPGFEDRLHAALEPELARILGEEASGATADAEPAPGVDDEPSAPATDELAHRRSHRRQRRSWPMALGGVAAGVALLAAVGIAITGLPGSQDEQVALDDGAGPEATEESAPAGPAPVLRGGGRELDDEALERLFDEPTLAELARRDLDEDRGQALAAEYREYFADDDAMRAASGRDAAADSDEASEPGIASDDAADGEQEAAPEPESADLDAEARADMRRCLTTLLDEAPGLVPAYAETATYQGEDVIVYGLLAPGAQGERYERLEIWVLERDDCQVRTFQQRDP